MSLTMPQQRALLKALSPSTKRSIRAHCKACQMRGEGIGSILKSVAKKLGHVGKIVGTVALKEFASYYIKKKLAGGSLQPSGGGLKLRGTGVARKKKRRVKRK